MTAKTPEIPFESFLLDVSPACRDFISDLHAYLIENGCKTKIELKSNGYMVSYKHGPAKRALANFVFRKKALVVRIYGEHVGEYLPFMDTLPAGMVQAIEKAPACKRLLNPTDCSSRCPMGYAFSINGAGYKKCRYSSFMFGAGHESNPFIRAFLENELNARAAE